MKQFRVILILLIAGCMIIGAEGFSQTITTSIVGNAKCPGEITIPVRVTNCLHIGAFSLVFSYDASILTYSGFQSVHPQLNSGSMSMNAYNGKVYFTWASVIPANIAADTLIKIKFTGVTGSSTLSWDTQTPGNCEYSDSIGVIKTSTYVNGTATVYQIPEITTHPVNSTVVLGQNAGFSVVAAGSSLTWQWQVSTNSGATWANLANGANYSNVTGASLNVLSPPLTFSGYSYRCQVGGACPPSVASNSATLTVNPVPQAIATTAGNNMVCPGNATIPITVNGFTGVGSFSLALNYNAAILTFVNTQNPNIALSTATGALVVDAYNGKVYLTWASQTAATIAANGILVELVFSGSSGSSTFSWDTQTPGNCEYSNLAGSIISSTYTNGSMSFYAPPLITTQPSDKVITQAQNTTFSVGASGTNLAYLWQLSANGGGTWSNLTNTAPYSGVLTSTLNITAATQGMTGYRYRCVVSGLCPSPVTSLSALLTVNPTPQVIAVYAGSKTVCPGTIVIPVYASNFNNVSGYSFAIAYNNAVLTYVTTTGTAVSGIFQANAANGKVYFTWANSSTISAGNDTIFRITFTGTAGSSTLVWDLVTPGACEIVNGSGIAIATNYSNGAASYYQPPEIATQPTDKSVVAAQSASFSVGAAATGITFGWQISANGGATWTNLTNTTPYSGVTTATMTVSNTTLAMSGHKFRCTVGGSCSPAVTSNPATLTVATAPQVIQVTARNVSSVCAGLIRQPVFATNFNGVAAMSLVLKYDTNILRFLGSENPNTAFNSGTFLVNNYKGKIYIVWAASSPVSSGNDTLFRLKFDCSGGNVTNIWDTQVSGNCEITNAAGNSITTNYTNGTVTVSPTCAFTDLSSSFWAYTEIQYLCGRGIVSGSNCKVYPDSLIKRSQLAKISFLGLFGSSVSVVSDVFPSPFNDLQNSGTYYYKYAKALSYLEYYDGIAPFDRNRFNFNPEENIVRVLVLKVLLETFDIPPDESGPSPFTDIAPGDAFYGYVKAAANLGIISVANPLFRPWTNSTRAEAFVMLERIIHNNPLIATPTVINSLNPVTSSFFIPGNYTPYNFSSIVGMEQGNFNHYTKTSFAIPGKGIPLNFEHTYNSYLTELPDEFLPMNPLGPGWSHTYNAYIINTTEVRDNYDQVIGKPCLIVFWPDGTMNVYDNTGSPANPLPITMGLYDQLTKISSTVYQVKTKSQFTFTFTKINGSGTGAPYVLTSISDRNSNTTLIAYAIGMNSMPRISSVKDPVNRQLTFAYQTGTNYISSITDPLNRHINFTVTDGRLVNFKDAKTQQTTYSYDTATVGINLLTSIQLPKGNFIANQYLQRKLVSSRFNNNSPVTIGLTPNYISGINDYSKSTVVEPLVTGLSVTTNYEFNRNGSTTKMSGNPATNFTSQFSNASNPLLPTAITNGNNMVSVTNSYDSEGNVTHIATSGNSVTALHEYFEYNTANDVTKHTIANGYATNYAYDANGNLNKVIDALGSETNMVYNSSGQLTSIINPNGVATGFSYQSATGMQESVTVPALGLTSAMTYDLAGRLLTVTDFKGMTNTYEYDNNDNLTQEKNAMNFTTGYGYDVNDNLLSITNAKGGITALTYDTATDWLLKESFQGNSRIYTYNADGSVKTVTDPNGNLFSYVYDFAGRVTSDGYATYAYNSAGNLQTITKGEKAIQFSYDGLNHVVAVLYDGFSVGYNYDNVGNITRIIYPGNKIINYTYDAVNRLKTVTDWNNQTTTYNYRNDGLLLQSLYPNNVSTTYTYDVAGRQTGMVTKRANNSVIAEYSYILDNIGNHTSEINTQPITAYPSMNKPLINYTYNAANRILTADTASFTFDFNGNTTGKTGYSYGFDLKNNLTSVTGRFTANYGYDGAGLRREASYNGVVKKFVLDILGMSKVLLETNANGTPQNYYVYGLGLISRIKPDNITNYYVSDFRGTTVALVDGTSNANITHKYSYDEFGGVTKAVEADFNPFRYCGKYGVMYEDSSLVFMRARYYDNSIGRFLSEDPVWSVNLYPYCGNNPAMFVDPLGRNKLIDNATNYLDNLLFQGFRKIVKNSGDQNKILNSTINFLQDWIVSGKYLGTSGVQNSNQWYEQKYTASVVNGKPDNAMLAGYLVTSLWLPETYNETLSALTLFSSSGKDVTKYIGKTGFLKLLDMRRKFGGLLKLLHVAGNTIIDINSAREIIIKANK